MLESNIPMRADYKRSPELYTAVAEVIAADGMIINSIKVENRLRHDY
jgi:hypothetical protein